MNEALLKKRLIEAPQTEPTDAVKLVYQNAFGCGHLLLDENACAGWLKAELLETVPEPAMPEITFIGNGLCRLNLAAPMVRRLAPERIAAMMRMTVAAVKRDPIGFEESLGCLERLAQRGETPFTHGALESYLTDYRAQGCPAVHHSEGYRSAYRPAYRVVLSDFAVLLPLILAIDQRLAAEGQAVCVLDGNCGAGKTTLAERLCGLYGASALHMDDFFLPFNLRTPERMGERGGNIHYERFQREVLPALPVNADFDYQRFDCATGAMLPRRYPASPLRVAEGSYALHPRFWSAYEQMGALTAFVTVGDEDQLQRLAQRSPAQLERFRQEWIPLEKNYFQAYDIKNRAKFVLHSLSWEGCL